MEKRWMRFRTRRARGARPKPWTYCHVGNELRDVVPLIAGKAHEVETVASEAKPQNLAEKPYGTIYGVELFFEKL
jgi:hypothetical protein